MSGSNTDDSDITMNVQGSEHGGTNIKASFATRGKRYNWISIKVFATKWTPLSN